MINHVEGDKVVVIRRNQVDTSKPLLTSELIDESLALDDAGADGTCPTRQAGNTSIDMGGCSDLKVPPLQVGGTEKVPEVWVSRTLRLGEGAYSH